MAADEEPKAKPSKDSASFLGGVSTWTPRPEAYEEYPCEGCLKPSRYTRPYTLSYLFFGLLFYIGWSRGYARCPRCMRRKIAWHLLPALLLANFLSPVVLLWWGGAFVKTFSRLPYDDRR